VQTLPLQVTTRHLAFAADLTRIAFQPASATVDVYGLPDTSLITRIPIHDRMSPWEDQVVWAGDAVVHLEFREEKHRLWRVIRHRPPSWSREVLADAIEGHAVRVGPIPAGFVVVAPDHLLLGGADGPLSGPLHSSALADGEAMLLATDPSTGRMAIILDFSSKMIVLDNELRPLAQRPLEEHDRASVGRFCGPDTLVALGMGMYSRSISSWRIEHGSLTVEGHTYLSKYDRQFARNPGLTTLPSRGRVVAALDGNPRCGMPPGHSSVRPPQESSKTGFRFGCRRATGMR
jgi:hypothetical protein